MKHEIYCDVPGSPCLSKTSPVYGPSFSNFGSLPTGDHQIRSQGGLLETPHRWHATIYFRSLFPVRVTDCTKNGTHPDSDQIHYTRSQLHEQMFIHCSRHLKEMHCVYPDRWEVGTWSTLHLASYTLLYAYITLPSGSAIQAEKKGTSSVALQVPFWATWVVWICRLALYVPHIPEKLIGKIELVTRFMQTSHTLSFWNIQQGMKPFLFGCIYYKEDCRSEGFLG